MACKPFRNSSRHFEANSSRPPKRYKVNRLHFPQRAIQTGLLIRCANGAREMVWFVVLVNGQWLCVFARFENHSGERAAINARSGWQLATSNKLVSRSELWDRDDSVATQQG